MKGFQNNDERDPISRQQSECERMTLKRVLRIFFWRETKKPRQLTLVCSITLL